MFQELGRRTEQFKQEIDASMAENADYECTECEEQFSMKLKQCPNCGSERSLEVILRARDSSTTPSAELNCEI